MYVVVIADFFYQVPSLMWMATNRVLPPHPCALASNTPAIANSLKLRHTSENTVFLRKQFIGSARLGYSPIFEDDNLVSSLHCAHPVGDDQHGLSFQET